MTSSNVAFVNGLEAMTVTGVTRNHTQGQPSSLNTADLPALWVDMPRADAVPSTSAGGSLDRTLTADLVVAIEPVGQNRRPTNFDAVTSMMDALHTALVTFNQTRTIDGQLTYAMKLAYLTVNSVDYWAVVTTISGLG